MDELHAYEQSQRSIQSQGQNRKERIYAIPCPQCEKTRWLKKSDALKALRKKQICESCSNRKKGKAGFIATTQRYGKHTATQHLQAYRLANPSSLELQVIQILQELAVQYEREVWFETGQGKIFLIDFVIPLPEREEALAIEVNGEYYHRERRAEDARKIEALQNAGYQVLVIEEKEIHEDKAKARIIASLE